MVSNESLAAWGEPVCLDRRYATTRCVVPAATKSGDGEAGGRASLRGGLRTRGYGKLLGGKPLISVITPCSRRGTFEIPGSRVLNAMTC